MGSDCMICIVCKLKNDVVQFTCYSDHSEQYVNAFEKKAFDVCQPDSRLLGEIGTYRNGDKWSDFRILELTRPSNWTSDYRNQSVKIFSGFNMIQGLNAATIFCH